MTRPTGSKPASFTSRNSLTDRSLVKSFFCRISSRRSRACCGRSPGNCWFILRSSCVVVGFVVLVELEGVLLGLLGRALDLVLVVVFLAERGVACACPPTSSTGCAAAGRGSAASAGRFCGCRAEPADVDVEVVELAAAVAARHLGDGRWSGRCPTTNSAPARRACSVTRSTTILRAVSTTLFALVTSPCPPPPEVTCQPWYFRSRRRNRTAPSRPGTGPTGPGPTGR